MKAPKKLLVFCLALLLLCIPQTVHTAAAADMERTEAPAIQPRYTNLRSLSVGFGIKQSDGDAICSSILSYYSPTDRVRFTVEFQRFENHTWTTFMTFIVNRYENPCDYEASTYVTSGYAYRAVVTADLYENGTIVETVSLESAVDTY